MQRDPSDRRYRERLAGSYSASVILHAVLAALLFSVLSTSSQEGATESIQGGEVVTLERRAPVVPQTSPVQAAAPQPHAPIVAPVEHAPVTQPARQRPPQNRHELAKIVPKATPNAQPIPQSSTQPNPQPTQEVYEPKPQNELPAVPTSVPSVATVAITVKLPPTAAPSPVPTVAPTAQPTPHPPAPTAQPTAKPATPAPPAPSAAPTAAVAQVKATAAPQHSPMPGPVASASPAAKPGVPSPSPTTGTAVAKTSGTAPSPGPKGLGSPGPQPGNAGVSKPGPSRPVNVPSTPQPSSNVAGSGGAHRGKNAEALNAKLRALLPSGNPVTPQSKEYRQTVSIAGKIEPTPPPDVLAQTKYIYEATGTGNERRIKMWVTSVRKNGPITMCVGWLVRYPEPTRVGGNQRPAIGMVFGGAPSGSLAPFASGLAPIVEANASTDCSERNLVPFAPSPASSP